MTINDGTIGLQHRGKLNDLSIKKITGKVSQVAECHIDSIINIRDTRKHTSKKCNGLEKALITSYKLEQL